MIVFTKTDLWNKVGDKIEGGHPCLVLRHDPPYLNIYALSPRPTAGIRVAGVTICHVKEECVQFVEGESIYESWV